jgi:hypothetical protein
MRWLGPTVSIIVSMFLPFLLWGSLVALLLTRNRVLYERAQSAPAAQKAEALIREWLSSSQLYDYERRNKFEVTGSAGGRYLIARGYIRDLDTGQDICFVPENWTVLPVADVMLARKIALESDEAGVVKVAFRG